MYNETWVCILHNYSGIQSRSYESLNPKITHEYAASHYLTATLEQSLEHINGEYVIDVFGRNEWQRIKFNVREYNDNCCVRDIISVESLKLGSVVGEYK